MHICYITHEYPKKEFSHGGIGSFLKTLAPKLVEKGVKVTIVGLNYENEDEFVVENGISIYRLSYFNLKGISSFFGGKAVSKKICEIHRVDPIDVVEGSELELAFIKKEKNIKYIIRLHGGHHFFAESENRKIKFGKSFREKRSFKKADAFVAVSEYVKNHTGKYLSYHNKPVELINYPINTQLFAPIETSIDKHSIVFAGSVCEKKGVRQLIQAFPFVKQQFPDATLEIYGREWFFSNGTSFTQLLQTEEIPKLGSIANAIHFHGVVDYLKIPEKYSKAHVCVFPSHMETQGLVAPEAMSMKKMVVFTNKGPGPETISNYETGLLCDPHNPQDIAEKINWVFSHEEHVKTIENNAREYVLGKFSLDIIVQKNLDFYQRILSS